jgi:hypothetical protein
MTEQSIFPYAITAWLLLAPAIFILLFFVTAPYGRSARKGWGPVMDARWAWFLMETPSWLNLTVCLLVRERPAGAAALVLYALWMGHYVYRSIVYPLSLTRTAHPWPVVVVLMGACFNLGNAYFSGRWLFAFGDMRATVWLTDPRFIAGIVVFFSGIAMNVWSDRVLKREKLAAGGGYVVPQGGLHRLVAAPNYLGEIVEWCGWALASWSLPGVSFVVWSVANLAPRAASHRAWYRRQFADYPSGRRRLVPWVW